MAPRRTLRQLLKLRHLLDRRPGGAKLDAFPAPSLPLEVWELVLEELSDESLRVVARVCSAFNDRCTAIHLRRHEISSESLAAGALQIYSPLLSVLQLSRLTPQIHTLVCDFWPFWVLRDMKYLGDFIRRLDGIQELHLYFAGNLLNSHTIDTIFPYSQHDLLTEFFDVIRAVVKKLGPPVVVLIGGNIYRARPRDLADWGLRYSLYWEHRFGKVGWVDKARFLLTNKGDPHLFLPVCRPNMRQEIEYTRPLHSVNVRAIPPALAANKSFTFMTLETDTTTTLAFGPTRYFSKAAIPGPELATIIPHITLPSLRTLNINQDVDPTVLHDFLCRHFTIVSIDYRVEETQGVPAAHADTEQNNPLLQRILTGAPLALPSLSSLSCSEPAQMITLLDTFGWSPYLSSIDLDFSRESAAQVASLKRALRRLSLHLALVSFHLCTKYKSQEQWLIDDEERHIVGCSYSIRCVHIRAGEMSEVHPLIPWLAMLPALARLEVSVFSWLVEDSATVSELEKLRAALPWVPEITVVL
ncbi:hypothetical protein B0H17DRAFT_643888 [Mycena rosella]|uniref:F-box domain-containing protein n=1 Tax=Mycena rosella TaxID=1033263 RepID=A0AAD7DDP4_MYCRO|nr:hypothetical protein B0H17DRAFT_643888 [Mycena rosella]